MNTHTDPHTVTQQQAAKILGIALPERKTVEPVKPWIKIEMDAQGHKEWPEPDYARFRLIINYKQGSDPKKYKQYHSLDWDKHTGCHNERAGLIGLLDMIWIKKRGLFTKATIYMNLTTNLSTKSRNYNYEFCYVLGDKPLHEYERRKTIMFKAFDKYQDGKLTGREIKLDLVKTYALIA